MELTDAVLTPSSSLALSRIQSTLSQARPSGRIKAVDADPTHRLRAVLRRLPRIGTTATICYGSMTSTNNRGVKRMSLADQAAEAVREMILVGDLLPGQHVTHDELAKQLGVSTMPVREALLRLTHQGFIVSKPGRHFEVTSTTRNDIDDIYWLHALLAGELTARATRNADPEFLDELRSIQEEWEALPGGASTDELDRLNESFHRLVNRQAKAPKLLVFLRNTIRLIPEHFYALVPEWRDTSTQGHRRILESIESGDAEQARQAAEMHVRDAGSLLVELFTDKGYWEEPGS